MGKVFQSFIKGYNTLLHSKRICLFQCVVNFILAILIAYPLKGLMENSIGHSLSLERAFERFDYTLINDFLQNYGIGLDTIKSQSLLVFAFYFCILVFFNAGIMHVVQKYPGSYKFREFLVGGAEYYWRFFRLSLYFVIFYLFLAFIGFKIATIEGLSPVFLEDERSLISRSKIVLIVFTFLVILLTMVQDIIKVMITKSRDGLISQAIISGFMFFRKHFFKFLVLALLHLLLLFLFLGTYYLFRDATDGSTRFFLLVFLLGQFFVLFRIGLRVWRLSSVYQMVLRV